VLSSTGVPPAVVRASHPHRQERNHTADKTTLSQSWTQGSKQKADYRIHKRSREAASE
jgi:hypothetical protein